MDKRLLAILATAMAAGVVATVSAVKRQRESGASRPFMYSQEDVTRFLRKKNISVEVVDAVRRNDSADELFVFLFKGNSNSYEALRITTNGIIRVRSPGLSAFPAADGNFAAWIPENGGVVVFRDGQSIDLPRFGLFDVDPSGRYFVVGEKPTRTWIGRTAAPQNRELIAVDVLGSHVFAKGNRIYVCGTTDIRQPSGRLSSAAVCLEIEDDGGKFTTLNRHLFEWADGIRDVDPYSDRLLLWNKPEVLTSVYVFDLSTKKRSRVGWVGGFDFFLRTNLLADGLHQ